MPSLKDVKNQIGAVKKTKQITKAMNMVASAKLRNAQNRIERFRPYAEKFYDMLGDLAAGADPSVHPLLERRDEIKTVGILVVTSDRGLCGSFNTNLNQAARKLAEEKKAEGKDVKFFCVGKKGRDFLRKRGFEIAQSYADKMNSFDFTLANQLGLEVIGAYMKGELDEVHLVFGEFISIARQIPRSLMVLPMQSTGESEAKGSAIEYIYEPSVEGLLAELLPRFIKVQIYRGLLDTSCSEHAARMAAMDNATKNCDDMIGSLTLKYNKARQATITKELMDIVGGAEALKG
ncbi:ATP synthase gamma chain [Alkalidesulfovibrio alkalitolerans DSM 16529]|jgi:F-type H+-transporting ATPase subunit gamma|uniref:ATP synthase gamma chain n=1 Tax=Alkalidesulfovibrio alkalitolerans DSM 16529 TaxID=1121439 RepID=S7UG71_9BACT|nr:F0F1 ATP synthase subunit gamma [Alkalidesulfovibrio alkalitolerans]EPR32784.1 ATP synthase gamma chain [Alkalidesulfovibrio alkalitolerans DSM 16529]